MGAKTYIVEYRRTWFDDVRSLKVLASNAQEARECALIIEGNRIVVLKVRG